MKESKCVRVWVCEACNLAKSFVPLFPFFFLFFSSVADQSVVEKSDLKSEHFQDKGFYAYVSGFQTLLQVTLWLCYPLKAACHHLVSSLIPYLFFFFFSLRDLKKEKKTPTKWILSKRVKVCKWTWFCVADFSFSWSPNQLVGNHRDI